MRSVGRFVNGSGGDGDIGTIITGGIFVRLFQKHTLECSMLLGFLFLPQMAATKHTREMRGGVCYGIMVACSVSWCSTSLSKKKTTHKTKKEKEKKTNSFYISPRFQTDFLLPIFFFFLVLFYQKKKLKEHLHNGGTGEQYGKGGVFFWCWGEGGGKWSMYYFYTMGGLFCFLLYSYIIVVRPAPRARRGRKVLQKKVRVCVGGVWSFFDFFLIFGVFGKAGPVSPAPPFFPFFFLALTVHLGHIKISYTFFAGGGGRS